MNADSVETRLRRAAESVGHSTTVEMVADRAQRRNTRRRLVLATAGVAAVVGIAAVVVATSPDGQVVAGPAASADATDNPSEAPEPAVRVEPPASVRIADPLPGAHYRRSLIDSGLLYVADGSSITVIDADLGVVERLELWGRVSAFDVSGDHLLAYLTRGHDGCVDSNRPELVESLDGGATWRQVALPWDVAQGRLADIPDVSVAVTPNQAMAARDSNSYTVTSRNCLLELGGFDPSAVGIAPDVSPDGVTFRQGAEELSFATWDQLGVAESELSSMVGAYWLGADMSLEGGVAVIEDGVASPVGLPFTRVWSAGGSVIGLTKQQFPGSSRVEVSADGTGWTQQLVVYLGHPNGSRTLVTDYGQPTGPSLGYSVDGGSTWIETTNPGGAQVIDIVELSGFLFAEHFTERISWSADGVGWGQLDLESAIGAELGSLDMIGVLRDRLVVSVRVGDEYKLAALEPRS